ncbi:3-dehydroquinate synthase [Ectothiorhodosinus mongolicus]|uniref:3-dehydroquinate synthase n=1 Tax=Ectothiorhodosinus mongolicus TaxID=233100 RepID=A0A1R3VV20_9GAMM|nr:3-dehydroquinate synthase [Ectothiorhodosinus mongolicus]ULX56874.1 3-dehydroquinate synthase [Ectothiorhodosinus mongolicus]SIT68758.1 3-dehydroquinate synthase [Ectothiorhodosinus mongolicus]
METLTVELGDRSYPIHIGRGLRHASEYLAPLLQGRRAVIITNETVGPLYLDDLRNTLMPLQDQPVAALQLADGEQYKNLSSLEQIYTFLLEQRLERNDLLIALGGGVIGDIAGFAAASYQRGIDFIQVPTTLLSQVDSSVGGKTGINHPLGKNMIGAFHQPRLVLIDTDTLNTLPDRELSAGLAEVIKYGLIDDPEFFAWLEKHIDALRARDPQALAFAIARSCADKARVVAEDEREAGRRALLNLGHTFGHAIETGMGYGAWLHGEAIAAGMMMAADLSQRLGWIDTDSVSRMRDLFSAAGLPVTPPAGLSPARFRDIMAVDKKVQRGRLRLVLLHSIGAATVTADFDAQCLEQTLEALTAA